LTNQAESYYKKTMNKKLLIKNIRQSIREKVRNIEKSARYFIQRNIARLMNIPSYFSGGQDTSLTVITSAYNEGFLAPLFFRHYAFAERIILLLDADTTDNTADIARHFKNVEIQPLVYPDGLDDGIKVEAINYHYSRVPRGYVLNVDMDEFAFIEDNKYSKYDLSHIQLYNVYRHYSESDLSIEKSVKEQRRHGFLEPFYCKPILVRAGLNLRWHHGNHGVTIYRTDTNGGTVTIRDNWTLSRVASVNLHPCLGAHWANADLSFCIQRRVTNRRNRLSANNLKNGWGVQYFTISEADVINECRIHENDPKVW
jgi:hypothetical protein